MPFLKWKNHPLVPLSAFYSPLWRFKFPLFFIFNLANMTPDFGMKSTNRSLLISLLAHCRQLLEETSNHERQANRTASNTTLSPLSSTDPAFPTSRGAYDNAYFYILFVMVFYSFLALSLFKCFIGSDEENKDPYEEFMGTGNRATQKGHMAEKFYLEEEGSL